MADDLPRELTVTVAIASGAGTVAECQVRLAGGATVRHALEAARRDGVHPADTSDTGIWGRAAGLDAVLRDGDRVESYRLLLVDPKLARRERFKQQGARATGLFARQRPGAKPGY